MCLTYVNLYLTLIIKLWQSENSCNRNRMTSLPLLTKEYLRSLSPLAQRIGEDVDAAQDAYQDLWDSLGYKEQQQVLDEAIIDPAAVLKYAAYTHQNPEWGEDFKSSFSWFTKSQLNLFTNTSLKNEKPKKVESFSPIVKKTSIVDAIPTENNRVKFHSDTNNLLNKLKNKVSNLKNSTTLEEKKNLVDNSKIQINVVPKCSVSKPKTPPPLPPVRYSVSEQTEKSALLSAENESDPGDEIPKTGFDFLDNW